MNRGWASAVLNTLMLVVAGIIDATGYALLLLPSHVIDGGIAGVSLLMSHATHLNASIFLVCVNLPFFFIGFKKMGWKFIANSLVVIGVYSLMTYIYTGVLHLENVVFDHIGNDMLLAAIFGGLCSGMGSGISIKCGGAIDGIDVMAVMFAKKIGITVGQFVMIFNTTMYIIGSIVLHDLRIGLYSILCYTIGLQAVDFVVNGFDKCKAVDIITERGDELAENISKELGRGITIINAKGYYSNEKKTMMYCVVNRFEVVRLKKLIKGIDPSAFVTVSDITDIMGSEIKIRRKNASQSSESIEITDEIESMNVATEAVTSDSAGVTIEPSVASESCVAVSRATTSIDIEK